MIRKFCNKPSGFSLIEIIAALLLISIVGGMLYTYFSSTFIESPKSLEKLQKSYDLHMVMETIAADYTLNYPEWQKRHPRWQKLTYYAVGTLIRADGNKGHIYKCKVAGKSGTLVPLGFSSGLALITDGTLTWEKKSALSDLRDKIVPIGPPAYDYAAPTPISNNYGNYMLKENKFIKFVWNVADSIYKEEDIALGDSETILKVTITNDSGTTLTNLFTNVN